MERRGRGCWEEGGTHRVCIFLLLHDMVMHILTI